MKTFSNLIEEVQKPGLCHRCGGCVSFCTAVNYGALELDPDGKPRYADPDKCIECGLCHAICPEVVELEEEARQIVDWKPPMGSIIEICTARAKKEDILNRATDGGVVTSLLLHLFDQRRIDGAIVTRQTGMFEREPFLATSREEIIEAAGFFFDTSHGMKRFSDSYLTGSSIEKLGPMASLGLNRVAFVGMPCQIKSFRRMQALGIVPADSIRYCLGLFCSGNFVFGEKQQEKIARIGNFSWDDVDRINIKEDFSVHLKSGETRNIPLDELEFMKRFACYFCEDYAAEFADVSFGGVGAPEGWTTVVKRTPLGRAICADARGKAFERAKEQDIRERSGKIQEILLRLSNRKKTLARQNRQALGRKYKL